MKKLAIITTHPIQYNAPLFQLLTARGKVAIKVFYTWERAQNQVFDPGFQKIVSWDLPLLDGYDYSFVKTKNTKRNKKSFWSLKNPSLIQDIEKWGANVVLVFGWNFYSHLQALVYFKGKIPVYFRGDSTLLNQSTIGKRMLRKTFLSWVYRHVDLAFYVGEQNKQYYLTHKLKESQLLLAPHAIDVDRFKGDSEKDYLSKAKEKLRSLNIVIPEGAIVFLFAGKFEPVKNPALLLKAFSTMKGEEAHLIMVGNGLLEQELKSNYLGKKNIHFIDFQNQLEMPVVYRMADVFVLPSLSETWGLAVNEAMACKRPVLVSDKVGCAVDLVKEGVNGLIFKHDSLEDLKQKLMIFNNKQTCVKMGEESFRIIQDYSFERICEVVESEIGKIAG